MDIGLIIMIIFFIVIAFAIVYLFGEGFVSALKKSPPRAPSCHNTKTKHYFKGHPIGAELISSGLLARNLSRPLDYDD